MLFSTLRFECVREMINNIFMDSQRRSEMLSVLCLGCQSGVGALSVVSTRRARVDGRRAVYSLTIAGINRECRVLGVAK